MMLEPGLPRSLWGEILLTSCVLRNLTPTSSLSVTPRHFIRQRVELGMVRLVDVRTEFMGADMMTKSVGPVVFKVNMKLIGMFSG